MDDLKMHEYFKPSPETSDKGKVYEKTNIVSLVLKMIKDDNIKDFKLSSNESGFGAFDDIIIETFGKVSKKYALQLKHSETARRVTLSNLLQENGDLGIPKYFKSYQEIGDSHELILFTNRTFKPPNVIHFEALGFSVKVLAVPVDPLLNTFKAHHCYKFEIIDPSGHEQYRNFFEIFFLYVNQAHCDVLEKSVASNFEQSFESTEFIYFSDFISKWYSQNSKRVRLNKKLMVRVIIRCVLSSSISSLSFGSVNNQMRLLREAINTFVVTFFEEGVLKTVRSLWGDARTKFENRLEEVNQIRRDYQLGFEHVTDINYLSDKNCTIVVWLMEFCPLIVTETRSLYKLIEICKNERFIIIEKGLEENLHNFSTFRNLSNLEPTSELYQNIARNFTCSIQGKEDLSLDTLIEEEEGFRRTVTTNDLVLMLEATYKIDGHLEALPVPYIERYLTRNIITFDDLKKIERNTLVVIECKGHGIEISLIRRLLRGFNLLRDGLEVELEDSNLGPDIYLVENESEDFDFGAKKYHRFCVSPDLNLEWMESSEGTEDLPFCIENGFTGETTLYRRKQNKINILIGEPGMGKSVLIRNFKNNIFQTFWVLLFYTEDILSLLNFLQNQEVNAKNFSRFVLEENCKNIEDFDRRVLERLMKRNQVVYIWDAIDEVPVEHLETITNVIFKLSEENLRQWVTSRCHLKKYLEKKFRVFSKKILQFTEEQQSLYIQQRLFESDGSNQNDSASAIQMIKKLIVHNEILGIPLQIYMLTELFRENPEEYSNLSKDKFNVTDLYRYFVEEKLNFYFKRKSKNQKYERLIRAHKDKTYKDYQKAALKALVPSKQIDCDNFLKEIKTNGDTYGIITEVTDENVPHFIHKSFGEYFAATYFKEHYRSVDDFENIIFGGTALNIRFFFDLLLAKDSQVHVAVLYKNFDTVQNYEGELQNLKDSGGRSLLHLACAWGQRYPPFGATNEAGVYIIDNSMENNYGVLEEEPQYVQMLKFLLTKCNIFEKDELFNFNSLEYCIKTNSLYAKVLILAKQDQDRKFDNDTSIASYLYYSAKFGNTEVFNLFKTFPFIRLKEDNSSYLHLAVEQPKFLENLLEIDKYKNAINDVNKNGKTAILRACQKGSSRVVETLIEEGANINIPSSKGRTPLHYACKNGNKHTVELLLKKRSGVDTKDKKNLTPLHIASFNGHNKIVKLLINSHASVGSVDNEGSTPLHSACINGHFKVIRTLIDSVGCSIDSTKSGNWTPLHISCLNGHEECVRLLVKKGAQINSHTENKRTPLHYASENGHAGIVEILVNSGSKIDSCDNEQMTPLFLATNNGFDGVAQILIREGADVNLSSPLVAACTKGHEEIVRLWINHPEIKINIPSDDGRTVLHRACEFGHDSVVSLLVQKIDINSKDRNEMTPLHVSCQKGRDRVVQLLLKQSTIDVNSRAKKEQTPLHYACQFGHDNIVRQLLLKNECTINARDSEGMAPLHLACDNGHERIFHFIRNDIRSDGINITNNEGKTPLHFASQRGFSELVKALIKSDANINAYTFIDKLTPLHLASQNGHEKVLKLLIDAKAEINCKTTSKWTPLHFACGNNYFRIVWLLTSFPNIDVNSVADDGYTPLHIACRNENVDIVKQLINSRANIIAKMEKDLTPLHLACGKGYTKICQLLLRHQDEIDICDDDERTPLFLACQNGHIRIVKSLLKRGANPRLSQRNGWSCLHVSCDNGHEEVVQLLIESMKSDFDIRDFDECTPLFFACENGHHGIVNLLIEAGANIEAASTNGYHPLHIASRNGHVSVVDLLLQSGVNVNATDKEQKTPLYFACEKGYAEIVKLLLVARANPKATTIFDVAVKYIAAKNGHEKVIELLKEAEKNKIWCIIPWYRKKQKNT